MIGGTSSMAPSSGRGTGERDAEGGPESSCTLTRLPVTAAFKIKDCSCKYQGKCMCVCVWVGGVNKCHRWAVIKKISLSENRGICKRLKTKEQQV